jgi:predicted deacetylase
MSVKFLLRFDDICPTMDWKIWNEVETILVEEGIKPILAVIPDNQDETLHDAEPNRHFWDRVRSWQTRGWTIGLHGYQHRYVTQDPGILGLRHYSEFAGLPLNEQQAKLVKALEIFRREGLRPKVWIAPAHSFDANTLLALASLGIRTISDGFALYPHRDSQGTFWIPQQLGKLRPVPSGVWTLCIHLSPHRSRTPRPRHQSSGSVPGLRSAQEELAGFRLRRRLEFRDSRQALAPKAPGAAGRTAHSASRGGLGIPSEIQASR